MDIARTTSDGTALPLSRCPGCAYEMDADSGVGGSQARPRPGDLSVCLNCGELLIFDEALARRRLTDLEFAGLDGSTRWQLQKVRRVIVQRGPFK